MTRNRHIAIAVAATALLTLAIIIAFATFGGDNTGTSQTASLVVAVLQIASVMVVATLALTRPRTRAFGWESVAAAFVLTGFVIAVGATGVGSGVAMVLRPPIGLVGILAFSLFDRGRPVTRVDRLVTVPASLAGIVLGIIIGLTATVMPGAWAALPCTGGCAEYGLGLVSAPWWSTTLQVMFAVLQAAAMVACVIGLAQRLRDASCWRRTVIRPVAWFGGAYAVIGLALMLPILAGGVNATLPAWADGVLVIRRLLLPLAIGAGMILAVILQRQAARTGVAVLRDATTWGQVEDAVQRLMGDPDVRLLAASTAGPTRAGLQRTDVRAPGGELLAVLQHEQPRDDEEDAALDFAVPGAALALDHIRMRERLATASTTERARMERDLHDGLQQHLVAMRMRLGLLEAQIDENPGEARDGLDDLIVQTEVALTELRLLARGEHMGLLAKEGLRRSLESVAASTGADVRLAGVTAERMPRAVEEAIYFTCREAMQNAMKHGDAGAPIIVTARMEGTEAVFEISDIGDVRAPEVPAPTPRTIAERAAGLGGTVETFACAAGGRRITGRVPLTGTPTEATRD